MIPKDTLVLVTWEDIQDGSNADWNAEPDELGIDTATIETVGWVVREYRTGRVLTVAKDRSCDDDTYRSHMAIPAGCVSSVIELKTGDELWDVGTSEVLP